MLRKERLSRSEYKFNFVIKGGLLISPMIGIDNRTTMDMDTTVKGIPLKEDVIKNIVSEL
ncbi:nucleotidyl transferase AbiEii/AbiGii toxin family protein [Pseudoramibacter faecis]|uniref:nucleotidyl transferase AbiEii/AbiGii toxin family protein n=1 Tax=Pseudoramibacter faecis TaxID=3108534 RepID=UPI003CC9CCA3